MRYDEEGRPVTISETRGGVANDGYELFWDDADRLIAVNIIFATPRICGFNEYTGVNQNCTGIRWHYHYLDSRLIAATREMVPSAGAQLRRKSSTRRSATSSPSSHVASPLVISTRTSWAKRAISCSSAFNC